MKYFRGLSLALLVTVLAHGCGYHIAGKTGRMPGDVKTLSVPVFSNSTRKPDIEATLTEAFVNEFLTTVSVRDDGEAALEGSVDSYSLSPVSYAGADVTLEYRLSVLISIRLVRRDTGEVLWEDRRVADYEDFLVNTTDVNATKDAEDAAFSKLSRDTARLVKERMLEDF